MSVQERSALMKFTTSVSRAPLGGFKHLMPPFTIHRVRTTALGGKPSWLHPPACMPGLGSAACVRALKLQKCFPPAGGMQRIAVRGAGRQRCGQAAHGVNLLQHAEAAGLQESGHAAQEADICHHSQCRLRPELSARVACRESCSGVLCC